jgi:ankyrin repeat protein
MQNTMNPTHSPERWTLDSSGSLGSPAALRALGFRETCQLIAKALRNGAREHARQLIENANELVASMTEEASGMTLLHLACQAGDAKSTQLLLGFGADPMRKAGPQETKWLSKKRLGSTPAMLAAFANSSACLKALSDAGPLKGPWDNNLMWEQRDEHGRSALSIAAAHGNIKALCFLLDARSGGFAVLDNQGSSPLLLACQGGHLDCVRKLLDTAPDHDAWSRMHKGGRNAMFAALSSKNHECVEALAQKALAGLMSNDPDKVQRARAALRPCKTLGSDTAHPPLRIAAQLGDDALFEILADASLHPKNGSVAESAALLRSCVEVIPGGATGVAARAQTLLDIFQGVSRAHEAISKRADGVIFEQVSRDIQIDHLKSQTAPDQQPQYSFFLNLRPLAGQREPARVWEGADGNGMSLLHLAVQQGNHQTLKELLAMMAPGAVEGASPTLLSDALERRDLEGRSPLAWAAIKRDASACEALLSSGARPDSQDIHGWTPFTRALEHGGVDLAKKLEHPGAKATRNFAGQSVAFMAAGWLAKECLGWLMEGADPEELFKPSRDGDTLLHAAAAGHCSTRLAMVLPGSAPNAQNRNGATALGAAEHVGFVQGVQMLLPFTDPALADKDGRNPLETAIVRAGSELDSDRLLIATSIAEWIDPRELRAIGFRWRRLLGPEAEPMDAPTLARLWGRPVLASAMEQRKSLWDQGAAPGQAPRQSVPAFGERWSPPKQEAPIPLEERGAQWEDPLPQGSKLVAAAAAAREKMAQLASQAPRVARGPKP